MRTELVSKRNWTGDQIWVGKVRTQSWHSLLLSFDAQQITTYIINKKNMN